MKIVYLSLLLLSSCMGDKGGRAVRHGKQLRIYNGNDSSGTEFPFMSLVLANTQFDDLDGVISQNMCGGSILSDNIILTAAHCVVREVVREDQIVDMIYHPRNLNVWVGDLEDPYAEQFLNVIGVIVHPGYDSYTVVNDLALLIVEPAIELTSDVGTIALPEDADMEELYAAGAAVTVIGWGTTESGETSDVLQKLSYVVTGEVDCLDTYLENIQPGMMCTGAAPMESHSSTGDSGGPLFTKVNGEWTQLGIVSWGAEVQESDTYDVNTDVGYYKSWIRTNMDSALTDYVSTVTATDSSQTLVVPILRKFLYKTILVKPDDADKFTKITIKSGTLQSGDFVLVYDGDSVVTDRMLAQLSGSLEQQCFTASSSRGITVAVVTAMHNKSESFTMKYKQVEQAGYSTELQCAEGYSPCSDRFYCLPNEFFCDQNGIGQCADGSDEDAEVCEAVEDDESQNTSDNSCSGVAAEFKFIRILITILFIRTFL